VLSDKKSCKEETNATDQSEILMAKVVPLAIRQKGETKEEKQARKQLVKQHNKVIIIMLYIRICTYKINCCIAPNVHGL